MNTEQAAKTSGKTIALFPELDRECLIIRPGESIWLGCVPELQDSANELCGISAASNHFTGAMMVQTIPNDTSPLILHPSVIPVGERLRVKLTNPSHQVCVIVRNNSDISSRLGHGIFRKAFLLRATNPIACASLLTDITGSKGVYAS